MGNGIAVLNALVPALCYKFVALSQSSADGAASFFKTIEILFIGNVHKPVVCSS